MMKIRRLKKLPYMFICFSFVLAVLCCCYVLTKRIFTNLLEKTIVDTSISVKLPFTDINSLKLIHSSNLCMYVKPKIVILVTSHVSNVNVRNAIRSSRPRDLFEKFDAQLVFLIAVRETEDKQDVEKEFRKHEDLVQGEFIEAYRNLTWKHLMGLRWVRDHCNTAVYIVKMDDDIVVNFYKLFEIINKFKKNVDLLGHPIAHMKPIRDITNKWYVSKDEFFDSEYPTFLSGWLYIMTIKAVTSILNVSNTVPYFWIDDVLISGILREKAHLKLGNISHHFRYEPKNIECCIMNKYSCDFLAAPNGKNYLLHLKLSNHLWECRHKKLCVLESSQQKSCWVSTISLMDESRWLVKELDI